MKKLVYVVAILTAMVFIACGSKGSQSDVSSDGKDSLIVEKPVIDKQVVEQQLVTFAEVEAILKGMENNGWSIKEQEIRSTFEAKGYKVFADETINGRIYCTKNSKVNMNVENYALNCSIDNPDSIASAVLFIPQGDMYVSAELDMFNDEVYNMMIDQAKACGFKVATAEEKQKYGEYANLKGEKDDLIFKGKFYLVLDKPKKQICVHYMFSYYE